ncbi:hypothetical protein C1645_817864 [Glomus cerebriforme]|uniref:Uncharacterized protein n=1 Tax=Glomus cerebriforme TaxID=658196 RepID=A0A397THV9_9GLOM|nr:hypothetical protein C1645_817864 [Glomus cerebriforme]
MKIGYFLAIIGLHAKGWKEGFRVAHIVQLYLIDPVLIDITNKTFSSTPLQEGATVTNHTILREAAQRVLENYTEKMVNQMNKGRKRPEIGDLVRISVSKIDHFDIDRPILPCRVLEKLMINTELETIPTNTITVRKAARLQNVGLTTGTICNCKGNCNSKKCYCRKMGNNYGSRCHGGH